jgi:AraC-like ligand binding domain
MLGKPLVVPRMTTEEELAVPRTIVALSEDHRIAGETKRHVHPRGQLLYAARGTLTTTAEEGTWVAPPQRAIWVPAGVPHVTRHSIGTELRSVFVHKDAVSSLPARCTVVRVSPLLRELLVAVVRLPTLYDEDGADGRLVRVLLDHVAALPDQPLHLPLPSNRKLRAIANDVAKRPGERPSLTRAARAAAMSPRSFARHFLAETGMNFRAWQTQARLLRAGIAGHRAEGRRCCLRSRLPDHQRLHRSVSPQFRHHAKPIFRRLEVRLAPSRLSSRPVHFWRDAADADAAGPRRFAPGFRPPPVLKSPVRRRPLRRGI